MQEIIKVLSLSKLEYYKTHLSIVNCILPVKMTEMELEVLANFMVLEGDIASYRFGSTAKKVVMNALKLSPSGMSNYLKALGEKGFIRKTGDLVHIWPLLQPENGEQIYKFKLTNLH